jgi:hypothetical protein
MKKLLIGVVAVTALAIASVPASAEIWAGANEGGVGVRVGPLGVGVGPDYAYRDRYYGDCRIVRERTVTPSGRVIMTRHRICD